MIKAPSTLGTFLRSFRWGHVRQLDRVSRQLLARAWAAGAGRGLGWLFCGLGLLFLWALGLLFLVFWTDRSMVCWKSCLSGWWTPACAGQTLPMLSVVIVRPVDPRLCGQKRRSLMVLSASAACRGMGRNQRCGTCEAPGPWRPRGLLAGLGVDLGRSL